MDSNKIEVVFRRAPDDPRVNSDAIQAELGQASKTLHQSGAKYSTRAMAFDAVDAVGYSLGEFIISLTKEVAPVLGVIVGAWLAGRAGRKVRVKIGDVEVEAGTKADVEGLLAKVEQYRREINPDE